MKIIQILVAMIFLASSSIQAQTPEINFVQDGKKLKMKKKKGHYVIQLQPEAFSIDYMHKELMLSAGLTKDLFDVTQPEIDAAKDYMSNFYLGKFAAFGKKSHWISISGDSAMMFSTKKGATVKEDGTNSITIHNWYKGTEVSLSSHKQVYMTLWLDTNLDLYMDPEEAVQVVLNFN